MLAVCLLSCGRPDLTRRTVESFIRHNAPGLHEMKLLHAVDECGKADPNWTIANTWGFRCVHAPRERRGLMAGLRALVSAAGASGCDRFLWLENDWESVEAVPLFAGPDGNVQCLRLYGVDKQADGTRPAGRKNMVTGEKITWRRIRGGFWEAGGAHFGGAPSICSVGQFLPHLDAATSMKDLARRVGSLRTLRVVDNIVWHIGDEGTPGFKH